MRSLTVNASGVTSSGTSRSMVTRLFDNTAMSRFSSMRSFCLPFNWSVFSSRFSTEPNRAMSFWAVFSPTPGTPGTLSLASPMSPSMSITWSTRSMPHFSSTSATPMVSKLSPVFPGLQMKDCSETSWA